MAETISFQAEPRDGAGKGPARQLRRTGRVPAVIYGERKDQQMISLEARALRRELSNPRFFSTLCSLQLDGGWSLGSYRALATTGPGGALLVPVSEALANSWRVAVDATSLAMLLGVLVFVGRRRQKRARAKVAEQRAQQFGR